MERLADDVMRVLIAPDGEPLAFTAGQYINIVLDDGQRRAFSFANPPHRARARSNCTCGAFRAAASPATCSTACSLGDTLRFEGPLGSFTLQREQHGRSCSSPAPPASRR